MNPKTNINFGIGEVMVRECNYNVTGQKLLRAL